MGAEQPEEQRWKTKYRALLEEQAANDEHSDALRQALIRLSHLFAGQAEDLDDLLEELRHKVRRGATVDDLQEQIALIDSYSDELELSAVSTESASPRPQTTDTTAEEIRACVSSDSRQAEPAFKSISDRIETVLIDMVSNLKVPESVAESKARIEQTLRSGLNWYELIATLEELSLLVAGTLYEGEKDYSGFLQNTISCLAELQAMIKVCQQSGIDSSNNSRLLEENIELSLQNMKESLQGDDIDKMKNVVEQGLASIAGNVQAFGEKQEGSSLELRENVHALSTQVLHLQQEVAQARKEVELHKSRATTDPLTKLPNRAAYEERLKFEYARWIRYQRPLSLAVGDVDFFKQVNDTHGHLLGDEVLQKLSALLKETVRKTDFVARYGGEEFVFLLPETDCDSALIALDKIREHIKTLSFNSDQGAFSVAMSFGITSYRESDNLNMAFARADQALYAAKQKGRDQCVLAPIK
ncbi:MAG: GGDEF domain-containing protein [Pseudomonadales bacterium]